MNSGNSDPTTCGGSTRCRRGPLGPQSRRSGWSPGPCLSDKQGESMSGPGESLPGRHTELVGGQRAQVFRGDAGFGGCHGTRGLASPHQDGRQVGTSGSPRVRGSQPRGRWGACRAPQLTRGVQGYGYGGTGAGSGQQRVLQWGQGTRSEPVQTGGRAGGHREGASVVGRDGCHGVSSKQKQSG